MEEHCAETLTVTTMPGKPCIFTFHRYTYRILHGRWYTERCDNEEDERKRVVETDVFCEAEVSYIHEIYQNVLWGESIIEDAVKDAELAFLAG